MIRQEIGLPPDADRATAALLIEQCCAAEGWRMTLKSTPACYPGAVHWPFKHSQQQ